MRQPPTYLTDPDFDHPHMQGLQAWYLMNEAGGRKIYDHSGWNRHMDLEVAPWTTTEAFHGPTFSGDTSERGIGPSTLRPTDAFTWIMWLYNIPFGGGNKTVMTFEAANVADGYFVVSVAAGGMAFFSNDGHSGGGMGLTTALLGSGLNQIVVVREGESITNGYKAYANGVFTGQRNSGVFADLTLAGPHYVGVREFPGLSGSFIQGYQRTIGSIQIYNRALKANEIADQFVNPFGPFDLRRPIPFPPTGLTPVMFSSVGRGPMRSALNLGGHRIGGAS